ncbi:putative indole-3-acetic acid-amido synthetase GH3.11 [Apostasia shenzhenica]|uniref:Putative indole-3-acetic acid-amido synthetase GH3.11 n=1 Tax=Apostasia shenzhenica TaxID=1088818 RepID=A0A2I0ASC5_9ASPA|nr:putative indole-3-acetic acid-amido synthetase GH3.11 [Apostasia shenzhenica]
MDGKTLEYKGEEALNELEKLTAKASDIQESILKEILKRNSATEYLSKYMEGSIDVEKYKKTVPVITYEGIQPYIQRIANGEDSSVISGHPITEFLISSGTSGGEPRLMPSIAEDLDRRTYLYNLIMPIMNQYIPGLDKGKAMQLLFVKSEMLTPSGLPARPVLTSYYKSPHFSRRAAGSFNDLTSPTEAILCPDALQSMYCQLLAGLIHRHCVLRLGAVFASALLRSIRFLERHWPDFVADIRRGIPGSIVSDPSCRSAMTAMLDAPNPLLADEVQRICSGGSEEEGRSWRGILRRLWPKARFIEAVLTGSMAQYVPALEFYGGGIPLVCTMYASSECYFGVNLRPLSDPAEVTYTLLPNLGFFEFLPLVSWPARRSWAKEDEEVVDGGMLVDLVDVKIGACYELVVTTFAGLYRYRVGDVLQVAGFHNQAPQFKFICRQNVVLSIDSDKTNEDDLHKGMIAAKKLVESRDLLLVEYTSYADTLTIPGHYVLFWEIVSTANGMNTMISLDPKLFESCCIAVEDSLSYVYRRCRSKDKSLGPLEIRVVELGTFEALMDLFISQGGSINQYKTPRCIDSADALKLLNSRVRACFFSPHEPAWSPNM